MSRRSLVSKLFLLLAAMPLAPAWGADALDAAMPPNDLAPPVITSSGSYQLKATLSPPVNRRCCSAVAMTKDLVGIRWAVFGTKEDNDGERGAAYVYSLLPGDTEWKFEARLAADDGAEKDHFGSSVAINNDVIAVGAPDHKDDHGQVGAVYVFRHNRASGSWDKDGPTLGAGGGHFGTSVALGASALAVGAPTLADSGYVTLFDYGADGWKPSASLTDSGTSGNCFGQSLSLRSNYLAIGAPGCYGVGPGQIYWAVRDGSGWNIAVKYASENSYGASIKIIDDNGHVAVGAPNAGLAGAVAIEHFYIPSHSSIWSHSPDRTVIAHPDPSHGRFGSSLEFSNNMLAIGTTNNGGNIYFYKANLSHGGVIIDYNAVSYLYGLAGAIPGLGSSALTMDSSILLAGSTAGNATMSTFDGRIWAAALERQKFWRICFYKRNERLFQHWNI